MNRLKEILMHSDLTLSAFLLGIGLIVWGTIAVIMSPADMYSFANAVQSTTFLFWVFNYFFVGVGFVCVSIKKFPPLASLLVGTYATLMWTWIASIRGSSNFTAGVTLNFIVIVMGLLLVQRSAKQ